MHSCNESCCREQSIPERCPLYDVLDYVDLNTRTNVFTPNQYEPTISYKQIGIGRKHNVNTGNAA